MSVLLALAVVWPPLEPRAQTSGSGGEPESRQESGQTAGRTAGQIARRAVRVGGKIEEPRKLEHVNPEYPEAARRGGVQGVVVLECTIGTDGRVEDVRVLQSVPLLDEPAIDAVKRWVYTPTLLQGEPVPVIMTVTVSFKLSPPTPEAPDQGAPQTRGGSTETPGDALIGHLVVPDVEAAIRHAEELFHTVNPAVGPGSIRQGLGAMLGDPGLAGLIGRGPVVLMAFAGSGKGGVPGPPGFAWFLPVLDTAPGALQGRGWTTRVARDALIVASTPQCMAQAEGRIDAYRRMRGARPGGDLRIELWPGRLASVYGPLVRAGLEQAIAQSSQARPPEGATAAAPTPEALGQLKLQAGVLLDLLSQLDVLRSDVELGAHAVTSDVTLRPRDGSSLAELSRMPPPAVNETRCLLESPGVMTVSYALDPARLSAFVTTLLPAVSGDADGSSLFVLESMSATLAWSNGRGTAVMRSSPEAPLVGDSVIGVADVAKALASLDEDASRLGSISLSGGLEAGRTRLGGSVERAARRHAGVAIHRLRLSLDAKDASTPHAARMKALLRDVEIALTRGYYLASQQPAALDRMIDRALSARPCAPLATRASEAFGEGYHLYGDYDLIGLVKAAAAATAEGVPAALSELAPSDPMSVAVALSGGVSRVRLRIPVAALSAIGRAAAPLSQPPGGDEGIGRLAGSWRFPGRLVWIRILPDGRAFQCRISGDGEVFRSEGALTADGRIEWRQNWGTDAVTRTGSGIRLEGEHGVFAYVETPDEMDARCQAPY